jgi:hypothetical protein
MNGSLNTLGKLAKLDIERLDDVAVGGEQKRFIIPA